LAELARSFNRMADSLQRGEERQRRLIADVAHELRTPLANLRGYLEALKDRVMQPDPELFSSLHEEAVLQQHIVEDLQDLALAEAAHWSTAVPGWTSENCWRRVGSDTTPLPTPPGYGWSSHLPRRRQSRCMSTPTRTGSVRCWETW
jgi:signal transduction histidine kinase